MNSLRSRLQRLMNKKHLDNKEQRELESYAAEIKEMLKEYNIDPEQHDFSDWKGIMKAWAIGLDAYLLTKYVDKAGNPIPAEVIKKELEQNNNNI